MAETVGATALEKNLSFGALVASLVSIPVIVMQTSSDHQTHQVGEWLGVVLWIYFLCEVVILVGLAVERTVWLLGHWLEVAIVIGTTPIFIFSTAQSPAGGSIAAIFGVLRVGRVVKLFKAVKAIKTVQKVTKDDNYTSMTVDVWVNLVVVFVVAGLIGMLADKSRHSLIDGLRYWIPSSFHFGSIVPFLGLLLTPVLFFFWKRLHGPNRPM